jgi:hypothetical protein
MNTRKSLFTIIAKIIIFQEGKIKKKPQ